MSTVTRTSSLLLAAVLGVVALPAAQAQSSAPQQDKTTRQPQAVDPFSPFVYDVLGATPSVHFRKGKAVVGQAGQQQASADRPVALQEELKRSGTTADGAKEVTGDVEVRMRTPAQE